MSETNVKSGITEFRVSFTADHEQYYQGHGIACTDYTHSGSGSGETLREALDEAIGDLVEQGIEVTDADELNMQAELISQCKAGIEDPLNVDIVTSECAGVPDNCINPDDYRGNFWGHNYKITLEPFDNEGYLVNQGNEQDAIDELIDYLERKEAENPGYFMTEAEQSEMTESELEEYVQGGNHGRYLSFQWHELRIEKDKGHDCSICAGEWHFYVNVDVIKADEQE